MVYVCLFVCRAWYGSFSAAVPNHSNISTPYGSNQSSPRCDIDEESPHTVHQLRRISMLSTNSEMSGFSNISQSLEPIDIHLQKLRLHGLGCPSSDSIDSAFPFLLDDTKGEGGGGSGGSLGSHLGSHSIIADTLSRPVAAAYMLCAVLIIVHGCTGFVSFRSAAFVT